MKFEVQKNGMCTILKLKERKLDSSISPKLKGEFLIICKPTVESLVVDLEDVEFCDSSGLSALLMANMRMKEHSGTVQLINVHKQVASLLKISMLDRVFDVQESPRHAAKR